MVAPNEKHSQLVHRRWVLPGQAWAGQARAGQARAALRGLLAAPVALALAAAIPAYADGPQIEILSWGGYAIDGNLGPLPSRYRQHTLSDVEMTQRPHFLNHADHITARLCTRFGIEYHVSNTGPGGVLTVRVTHPRQERPDGQSATDDEYDTPLGTDTLKYTGFEFDYPWEMVPGTWTFSLLIDGRVLAEKSFTVTVPADANQSDVLGCTGVIS